MSRKRRRKNWSIGEKLEIIQARQKGLKMEEIMSLYGVHKDMIYRWDKEYRERGIPGLETARCKRVYNISPKVKAAEKIIDSLAEEHPVGGIGKMQGILYRYGFLGLARETVRQLWLRKKKDAQPAIPRRRGKNKPYKPRKFERARPNQLWQTDIMGFMLKGQYRVYLIGFMDDYSRFMVGWGLHRFQTTANVMEVFRGAIEKHNMPEEVLSDNGRQYYTWRGSNKFSKLLVKLGIRHIRSRSYHPQTLGKIESFWRNLTQECLSQTPLSSFEEAQAKIGEYIEYYNFKRPHQGIENLIPSDRYFNVAGQVKNLIDDNARQIEEQAPGEMKEYTKPTYLVGNFGGQELRMIARDARVSLEKPAKEIVQSDTVAVGNPDNNTEKAHESEKPKGKTAECEGPVGTASCGPVREEGREGAVPGGRDIAGIVLPVDETVKETSHEDAESGRSGSGGEGEHGPGTGEETCDKGICIAEEAAGIEERGRTPAPGGENSAEDNKEAGLDPAA